MKLDTIGKNIRKFRLARKLRQEDLAEKTEMCIRDRNWELLSDEEMEALFINNQTN